MSAFLSSAKFRFHLVESLKSASRFLFRFWSAAVLIGCVSRLRFCSWSVYVGSQNRLVFFLPSFGSVEFVQLSRLHWRCSFLAKSGFPNLAFWLFVALIRKTHFYSKRSVLLSRLGFGQNQSLLYNVGKLTGRSLAVSESASSTAPNTACT